INIQSASIINEACICMSVPIVIVNHGVIYNATDVPLAIGSFFYSCAIVLSLFEIANCYVSCMYYRRNVIVSHETNSWKQGGVLVLLRVVSLSILGIIYFLIQKIQIPRESASHELGWLENYLNVMYISLNNYVIAFLIGIL
ncbi:hypothetical protein PENTCL1PPCAC_26074, partial [Pristionchus entomophagus]